MKRDPLVYLWDVRKAATSVNDFLGESNYQAYVDNDMLRSAIERQFEIIGEALNQLNKQAPDIGEQIPSLRDIVNFRNLLIHGYASINHAMVWQIIQGALPELLVVVNRLIETLDDGV